MTLRNNRYLASLFTVKLKKNQNIGIEFYAQFFFDTIPILCQMLDSVDARCRFRLIVPSLVVDPLK